MGESQSGHRTTCSVSMSGEVRKGMHDRRSGIMAFQSPEALYLFVLHLLDPALLRHERGTRRRGVLDFE
jgi:hypothetical protein